ncbi:MAG: 16S rRNA (adenine(1518)-N(6)/adenine(1519)-N(6))-dimethyltransferase RsmA [Candidatus Omnitrophota bacterium]
MFDKNVQNKILRACALRSSDTVLEIGAGYGALTGLISQEAQRVAALEIDSDLCAYLREHFAAFSNISVIHQDILKFDLRKHFSDTASSDITVIGNIPYYITSPIIEHLFEFRDMVKVMYLTVQKEFAERIIAVPGSKTYGSFSCFVQYHAVPKILFLIKKNSFKPAPKVDSCFIRIALRPRPAVEAKNEASLFTIIRKAFNQRRKTLRNSLSGVVPEKKLSEFFISRALDADIRPEDMALEDFAALANMYEQALKGEK